MTPTQIDLHQAVNDVLTSPQVAGQGEQRNAAPDKTCSGGSCKAI